eukprot:gene23093-59627_t
MPPPDVLLIDADVRGKWAPEGALRADFLRFPPGVPAVVTSCVGDAEGHDAAVLRGAPRALAAASYVEFEHQSFGRWRTAHLRNDAIDVLNPSPTHG